MAKAKLQPDWDADEDDTDAAAETRRSASVPNTREKPPVGMVHVKCIVKTEPWTEHKKLKLGEVATIPEAVAALMERKEQVVRL